MHTSYCALGLGVVLVKIPGLFHLLRILGAAYLFYLSIKIFFTKAMIPTVSQQADAKTLTAWQAYRLGFFTNALNPKAMLFILGIFIMVAKFDNPWWSLFFVLEMTLVTGLWFLLLAHCFSRPRFKAKLIAIQGGIAKCLAVFLSVFAIQLLLSTGVK